MSNGTLDKDKIILVLDDKLKIASFELSDQNPIAESLQQTNSLEEVFTLSPETTDWLTHLDSLYHKSLVLQGEKELILEIIRLPEKCGFTATITPPTDVYNRLSSLDLIDAGSIVLDDDLHLISCNAPCHEYFGVDLCQHHGNLIWDAVPELTSTLFKPLKRFQNNPSDNRLTLYFPPNGLWFDVTMYHRDHSYILIFANITELKNLEKKARDSEAFLAKLLDSVYDGIVAIDTRGTIILANKTMTELSGYSHEELIDKPINMLMDKKHSDHHDTYMKRGSKFAKGHVVDLRRELQMKRKDGKMLPIDIAVTEMFINEKIVFIGSIHDVSQRIIHEKRIRELARFPEETWNPVLKIESGGVLSYANSRTDILLDHWGIKRGEIVPPKILDISLTAITTGDPERVEIDCGDVVYSVLFAPALNSVYVYGTDITKNKRYEAELLEHRSRLEEMVENRTKELALAKDEALAANQAKSTFLANMSHEMRTPLTAIVGYAETLLDEELNEDERNKCIDTIIRSSAHLKEIINDVLDISKIEAEKLELESIETDLAELLRDVYTVMSPLTKEKSLTLNTRYETPVPKSISTDPTRLKQVLINLCSNAIKFTSKGSIDILVTFSPEHHILYFKVCDSGIGIDKENLEKIFDKFSQADSTTTRQFGGTGLGLPLSRQLSRILGGDLTVESQLGKGSCFTVSIAVAQQPHEIPLIDHFELGEKNQKVRENTGQILLNGYVLVVEDTPALQELACFLLKRVGITVQVAQNGREGLEKALEGNFDLILMDLQMPEMDGLQAAEELRKRDYKKPLVAMTANVTKEDKLNCLSSGFNEFVAKPINKNELYAVLEKYLRRNDTASAEPIYSGLLEEEPEMRDLVNKFANDLPQFIVEINKAYGENDLQAVAAVIHKLKGLGGGYGYPMLTDLSTDIEYMIKENKINRLGEKLNALENLVHRITSGVS